MYRLDLNNYYLNKKNSTIYTPKEVSQFLFDLLSSSLPNLNNLIVDPCCGGYSLLTPWKKTGYQTIGIDNDFTSQADFYDDFLQLKQWIYQKPTLILCNPPFNGAYPQLAPEIWLDKILELFGKDIPLVLFVPSGFRLNLTLASKRHEKFTNGKYPLISSIISLPKNIFEGVKFHSEILIFNIPNLQPHYFFNHYESRS